MMMFIDPKIVCLCMLLAGTAVVSVATDGLETTSADTGLTQNETTSNETRVWNTRTCSKLEYYDKLKQKCRDFPGGGVLVIMDHSTKCAHGDSGLHTFSRRDYYYVCHPEGVMIGLCPEKSVFSDTEKRCIIAQTNNAPATIKVHDESQNCNIVVPDCNGAGLFPIPSNCSFYFKCQEHNYDFYQYIYQCPPGKVFHPDLLRCSSSIKCYDGHEDILNNFNKDYFPECHILGLFRTAKDCSLYYRCVPAMDGSFYQIRYECPYKMYYSIEKEMCMPDLCHSCDYIPLERIIEEYKMQHRLESSTLAAQPTTVISAINTKITSSIPAYYETTQPLDVNEPQSSVQGSNKSYSTTEKMAEYTSVPSSSPEYTSSTNDNLSPQTQRPQEKITSTTSMPRYYDINDEERSNTDINAMSLEAYYTEEGIVNGEDYTTGGNNNRLTTLQISDSDKPAESNHTIASGTSYTEKPSSNDVTLNRNEPQQHSQTSVTVSETEKPRVTYDDVIWDSDAWVFPNRKKGLAGPDNDSVATVAAEDSTNLTSRYDHYIGDAEVSEVFSTTDPGKKYVANDPNNENSKGTELPTLPSNYSSNSNYDYTMDDFPGENLVTTDVDDSNKDDSQGAWNAVEINCAADNDGEIVCNGQKLSRKGYLEILGYTIKLTKWRDLPSDMVTNPGPVINLQLTLQHPFNYILEANATEYSTSFSYDYSTTAGMQPTTTEV